MVHHDVEMNADHQEVLGDQEEMFQVDAAANGLGFFASDPPLDDFD